MKIKKTMLSFALVGAFTLGWSLNTNANPFWGAVTTSNTDWADGHCTYRETCTVHYIFWIPGEETCTTEIIACLSD